MLHLMQSLNTFVKVGHTLFWHLKNELHDPHYTERFGVILEEYLSFSGRHASELRKQVRNLEFIICHRYILTRLP